MWVWSHEVWAEQSRDGNSHISVSQVSVCVTVVLELYVSEVHMVMFFQIHRTGLQNTVSQAPKPHIVPSTGYHPKGEELIRDAQIKDNLTQTDCAKARVVLKTQKFFFLITRTIGKYLLLSKPATLILSMLASV